MDLHVYYRLAYPSIITSKRESSLAWNVLYLTSQMVGWSCQAPIGSFGKPPKLSSHLLLLFNLLEWKRTHRSSSTSQQLLPYGVRYGRTRLCRRPAGSWHNSSVSILVNTIDRVSRLFGSTISLLLGNNNQSDSVSCTLVHLRSTSIHVAVLCTVGVAGIHQRKEDPRQNSFQGYFVRRRLIAKVPATCAVCLKECEVTAREGSLGHIATNNATYSAQLTMA